MYHVATEFSSFPVAVYFIPAISLSVPNIRRSGDAFRCMTVHLYAYRSMPFPPLFLFPVIASTPSSHPIPSILRLPVLLSLRIVRLLFLFDLLHSAILSCTDMMLYAFRSLLSSLQTRGRRKELTTCSACDRTSRDEEGKRMHITTGSSICPSD